MSGSITTAKASDPSNARLAEAPLSVPAAIRRDATTAGFAGGRRQRVLTPVAAWQPTASFSSSLHCPMGGVSTETSQTRESRSEGRLRQAGKPLRVTKPGLAAARAIAARSRQPGSSVTARRPWSTGKESVHWTTSARIPSPGIPHLEFQGAALGLLWLRVFPCGCKFSTCRFRQDGISSPQETRWNLVATKRHEEIVSPRKESRPEASCGISPMVFRGQSHIKWHTERNRL